MPVGAQILAIQTQAGMPVMWALVDPDAIKESRTFVAYHAEAFFDANGIEYIGTFQLEGFPASHVFEQKRMPTTDKLAQALSSAGAPEIMIQRANEGYYDDFKSNEAWPIQRLVSDARSFGLSDIAERAKDGEFDAQQWEADGWARSRRDSRA